VHFELAPVEHDVVSKAMKKAAGELSRSLGGKSVDRKQVLIFSAQRQLATRPDCTVEGRTEREDSMYNILYHVCPQCRTASLPDPDWRVEIPPEVVERVEGEAHKVTLHPEEERKSDSARADLERSDKQNQTKDLYPPNNPTLVRKVRLRDGCVCANPHCRRRLELQAHHIVFRREGGATALWNEVALCSVCHSLVHMGYLQVDGNPLTGLRWKTRVDTVERDVKCEEEQLVCVRTVVTSRETVVGTELTQECGRKYGYLLQGLVQLGCERREARKGIGGALDREPTDEEILKGALQSPRVRTPHPARQSTQSSPGLFTSHLLRARMHPAWTASSEPASILNGCQLSRQKGARLRSKPIRCLASRAPTHSRYGVREESGLSGVNYPHWPLDPRGPNNPGCPRDYMVSRSWGRLRGEPP